MADPYARLAKVALKLITKFGRPVTVRFEADGALPDADRPWAPGARSYTDFDTMGVVSPADEAFVDGEVILATDEQAIVPALGMPGRPTPKTVLVDGSVRYQTLKVNGVDPGPTPLAYIFFLRR